MMTLTPTCWWRRTCTSLLESQGRLPDCPLGRPGKGTASQQALRLHFSLHHPNGLVGMDGNLFPHCEQCGVQTRDAGYTRHESTTTCRSRAERRDRHAVAAHYAATTVQSLTAHDKPLRQVEIFKYLGRLIAYDDTDVPAARRRAPARCGGNSAR